jgi:hypothetical protein
VTPWGEGAWIARRLSVHREVRLTAIPESCAEQIRVLETEGVFTRLPTAEVHALHMMWVARESDEYLDRMAGLVGLPAAGSA